MRYAYFDLPTGAVVGWIDTVAFNYSELPDPSMLIELTSDEDWHQEDGNTWYVVGGALTTEQPVHVIDEIAVKASLATDSRNKRALLLSGSDWLVQRHRDQIAAEDNPSLTAAMYAAVLAYRQKLRDIPTQSGFLTSINWPVMPVL